MAKAKSKSKKSKKTSAKKKQQPKVQATSANQQSVKKPEQQVEVVTIKNQRSNAKWGLLIAILIALVIGAVLIFTAEDKSIKSSAKPTPNPSSQQTIKVVEPNKTGTPEPTGYQIQGSSPTEQEAQGGLQQPQTADQLQPNAKIEDYENADLN